MIDLRPAAESLIAVLTAITHEQLSDPTPCPDYCVGDLVDHMQQVATGFAAIARKERSTGPAGQPSASNLGSDWRETLPVDLRTLADAWRSDDAWSGVPPDTGLDLDSGTWGRIALTELVVHGWDLAVATGHTIETDDATLQSCFDHVVVFVPNAPVPQLWGDAQPAGDRLLDRIVAVTGRDPEWTSP